MSPSEWASGRVALQDGLTPKYESRNAPWQIEPLDSVGDTEAKEIVYLAPIGTGKTNLLQIIAAQLIKQGVSVWWFDTQKKCGLYLARVFPQMLYLSMGDLQYNPFEWIPGRTDKKKLLYRQSIFFQGSTIY